MKARLAVATILTVLSMGLLGASSTLVEKFDRVSPATGALYAHRSSGDLGFLCSVTAVGQDSEALVILTAYHCVQQGVAYKVTFDGREMYPASVWKIPHYEVSMQKYPRLFGEPKTDMVFFRVFGVPEGKVPTIPLGDESSVKSGSSIITVGFPLGVAKVSYQGSVAGRLDRPGHDEHQYLLLQIFGAPGSSGSSVIDVDSMTIVGVLVSASTGSVGLPVIFATPISYQKYLMDATVHRK